MRMSCEETLNEVVMPKVKPTVPTAEAVSNKHVYSGRVSLTLIKIAPVKHNTKYITPIVDAFLIISSDILLLNK